MKDHDMPLYVFVNRPMPLRLGFIIALILASMTPVLGAELIMFERAGCPWCERWNTEIGPIYGKTDEGKRAPLRRVDIHAERPSDLRTIANTAFTPTFVLIEDGKEIGRIRGYPGDEIFWWLLGELMKKLDAKQKASASKS